MTLESISGYVCPFSPRFYQATRDFHSLKLGYRVLAVALAALAGLTTLPLGGIGGFATFRTLVDCLPKKEIGYKAFLKEKHELDSTENKTDQTRQKKFQSHSTPQRDFQAPDKTTIPSAAPHRTPVSPPKTFATSTDASTDVPSPHIQTLTPLLPLSSLDSPAAPSSGKISILDFLRKEDPHENSLPLPPISQAQKIPFQKGEKTSRTGNFCASSETMLGPIGKRETWTRFPDYLDKLTHEDGSPLPLDPEDFFLEFQVFEKSWSLQKLPFPSTLYLPASLFKEKKEGDTVRLRYENQLIELTLNQTEHGEKWAKCPFEKLLDTASLHFKLYELGKPSLFAAFNKHWWYDLGEKGALYQLKTNKEKEDTLSLEQVENPTLRQLKEPSLAGTEILFNIETQTVEFIVDFPRSSHQNIDLILNERDLILYCQYDYWIPPLSIHHITKKGTNGEDKIETVAIPTSELSELKKEVWNPIDHDTNEKGHIIMHHKTPKNTPRKRPNYSLPGREMIALFKWNQPENPDWPFNGLSIEEIKARFTQGHASITEGWRFTLSVSV